MTDKAPIVLAEVRGHSHMSMSGQGHYMGLMSGNPVIITREPTNPVDPNAVKVNTVCCGVQIGYIGKEDAAILAKWMDKGWQYTAAVKNTATVANGYVGPLVTRKMVVRCVPIEPLSIGKTTKVVKEKEVEDA